MDRPTHIRLTDSERSVPMSAIAAIQVEHGNPAPSDSRGQMDSFLKQIAEALGLEGEASEDLVLGAVKSRHDIGALAEPLKALEVEVEGELTPESLLGAIKALGERAAASKDDKRTLEERASAEGKRVVKADEFEQLKAQAAEGAEAAKQLRDQRFESIWEKALREGRTAPVSKDHFKTLYGVAADETIEAIDKLPKIVSTEARGSGAGGGEQAPEGVDAKRHELDRRVRAYMAERSEPDYTKALDAVVAAEEVPA